jgi:hypothetical protein
MFKGARGVILVLLGAAAIITCAFIFGFRGPKDDIATARTFLNHLAADEITEAQALLHPSATQDLANTDIRDVLGIVANAEPFAEMGFPFINFSVVNGLRTTEISGTGTTARGCESALSFVLLNGEISFFNIEPLCGGPAGTDA